MLSAPGRQTNHRHRTIRRSLSTDLLFRRASNRHPPQPYEPLVEIQAIEFNLLSSVRSLASSNLLKAILCSNYDLLF
jgi:hypothetical protein